MLEHSRSSRISRSASSSTCASASCSSFSYRLLHRLTFLVIVALLISDMHTTPVTYAATVTVTTTDDIVDAHEGKCNGMTIGGLPGPDGVVSLREAICATNYNFTPDVIVLAIGGDYELSIVGAGEDENASGDLDILDDLTITVAGTGTATIRAGWILRDRVIHIGAGVNVTLERLIIKDGHVRTTPQYAAIGGGVLNENGRLTVRQTTIIDNRAIGLNSGHAMGGGLASINGRVTLEGGSRIERNSATGSNAVGTGGNGLGGGIYSENTRLVVQSSTIERNSATGGSGEQGGNGLGGGIYTVDTDQGNVELAGANIYENIAAGGDDDGSGYGGGVYISGGVFSAHSTSNISRNVAYDQGGGVFINGGITTVSNSSVTRNQALGEGGAEHGGGGMFIRNTKATFTNSPITNNRARQNGGGIASNNSELMFTSSPLRQNTSLEQSGGGIFVTGGDVTVTDSAITDNRAERMGGGGVFRQNKQIILTNSPVNGNQATIDGGGLYVVTTKLVLDQSAVSTNSAGRDGGGLWVSESSIDLRSHMAQNQAGRDGGGAALMGSRLNAKNVTIDGNQSRRHGGGIFGDESTLVVDSSTLSNNQAQAADTANPPGAAYGGGLFGDSSIISLVNSTVSGNRAQPSGGGIRVLDGSTLTMHHVTIANNSAQSMTGYAGNGGGVVYENSAITIRNSIIAGNRAEGSGAVNPDVSGNFTVSTIQGTLIGDRGGSIGLVNNVNGNLVGGGNLAPIDARLAPLGAYGGSTQTHALRNGSPALDAGRPDNCIALDSSALTTDQRGVSRAKDANLNDASAAICDMGAYEAVAPVLKFTSRTHEYLERPNSSANPDTYLASRALQLSNDASVSDDDFVSFDRGALRVVISNGTLSDRLDIARDRTDISVAENTVRYQGNTIGTFGGRVSGTTPMIVTLTSGASLNAVGALINAIVYEQTSDNPESHQRMVVFVLEDGHGGTSAQLVQRVNVVPQNDAPSIVRGEPLMPPIPEDIPDNDNQGVLIADLIRNMTIADPDSNPLKGIAIIETRDMRGVLEFSLDGGATWQAVGNVSDESALLLSGSNPDGTPDSLTRLRFRPEPDFNNTKSDTSPAKFDIFPTFVLRAWDQTSGTSGLRRDASFIGGISAFSEETRSVPIAVVAVADDLRVWNFSKEGVEDTDLPFAADDFRPHFLNPDIVDSPLTRIQVVSLPIHGTLHLTETVVTTDIVTLDEEVEVSRIEIIDGEEVEIIETVPLTRTDVTTKTNVITVQAGMIIPTDDPVINLDTLIYRPKENFCGADSFGWIGSDATEKWSPEQNAALAEISIVCLPDPPVALDDYVRTPMNRLLRIPKELLLANDSDPDEGDVLSVVDTDETSQQDAIVRRRADSVEYEPVACFVGDDQFTYTIKDTQDHRASATVHVEVGHDRSGPENSTISFSANDFRERYQPRGNDPLDPYLDPYLDSRLMSVRIVSLPREGTLLMREGAVRVGDEFAIADLNRLTYQPRQDYHGNDSFQWQGGDESGFTDEIYDMYLYVEPVNQPPIAQDDRYPAAGDDPVAEGRTVEIGVLANDSDRDSKLVPESVRIITPPPTGSARVITTTGAISYTTPAGIRDAPSNSQTELVPVSFTYQVCDDGTMPKAICPPPEAPACSQATVTVMTSRVVPPECFGNRPPIARDDPDTTISQELFRTAQNRSVEITGGTLMQNDSDPDGDTIRLVVPSQNSATTSAEGRVTYHDNRVVYTPKADFVGTDTFQYFIVDSCENMASATANVTVRLPDDDDTWRIYFPIIRASVVRAPEQNPTPTPTGVPTMTPIATSTATPGATPTLTPAPTLTPGPRPDLVVAKFSVEPAVDLRANRPATVTVVIENRGAVAAEGFWVDFYISPSIVPSRSGYRFKMICSITPCRGIVWPVRYLGAGQQMTLTSIEGYDTTHSDWNGMFEVEGVHDLFVYVDSWAIGGPPEGAVLESNEQNNRGAIPGITIRR